MKKIYSLLMFVIIFSTIIKSQNNNLVIYSQEGLKFTVILNGIRQNMQPETNVKITGLNAPNYQVKLILANNMPDVNQNVYLMYGGELTLNTEYTYALANVKGKYKLRFKSTAPINGTVIVPQQNVIVYNPSNTGTTTTTTTNVVGTSTTTNGNVGNIGVNIGSPGVNVNVNTGGNTTTTTTSTTSVTTTTINSTTPTSNYVLPGYNGVYGCQMPMSASNFSNAKKSIASKSFDESRLTIAKQIIGSNCLLCSQIKELMELMTFEATRLDLAKFAWHHTLDKGNYYMLNDAFTFESSISDLNKYTQTH